MGEYFLIANVDKRQFLSAGSMNESSKRGGFLRGLHGRALALLVCRSDELRHGYGELAGSWYGDRVIALLPGPPREMRPMMRGPVRDRLLSRAGGLHLERRALRIAGRSESRAEEMTQPIYSRWLDEVPRIETTILATPGLVELHLSTRVADRAADFLPATPVLPRQ